MIVPAEGSRIRWSVRLHLRGWSSRLGVRMTRILILTCAAAMSVHAAELPLAGPDLVFEEKDGLLTFEAEHFHEQTKAEVRKWYLTTRDHEPRLTRCAA